MNAPFFSVIVPTYNRAHLILQTLNTIFNQEYQSFEIIVIDDGSTDNTAALLNDLQDQRLQYHFQDNKERGAARNKGIDLAKGLYVTFCDSDDILYPDYLLNAYDTISKNPGIEWMHLAYEIRRQSGNPIPMRLNRDTFIHDIARGNPLSCMGVFVRADIIREIRFNENRHLSGSEDWELWLRLAAHYPIVVDTRISSALLLHDERSVIHTSELKLQLRKYLSIGFAFDDIKVKEVFTGYYKVMSAYFDTYISLHLLLGGENAKGMFYLTKGIIKVPTCIFERRFLAIIKLLIHNLLKRNKQ